MIKSFVITVRSSRSLIWRAMASVVVPESKKTQLFLGISFAANVPIKRLLSSFEVFLFYELIR